jgi:hypothetical protein
MHRPAPESGYSWLSGESFHLSTLPAILAGLIPSLFVFDLFHQRPSLFPDGAAVFALGWWMKSLANLGPNDYFDQLGIVPRTLLYNLQNYFAALRSAWSNGYFPFLQSGLFAVVIILTLTGIWLRLRSGITIYEIFAAFYLVLIMRIPANLTLPGNTSGSKDKKSA